MGRTFITSSDQERRTPAWLYHRACSLLRVKACVLDAFASESNRLCTRYYDAETNGLRQPWHDATFANPPFKLMAQAVAKAMCERERGVRSVLVGPSGCSQRWFHGLLTWATVYLPDQRIAYLSRDGTTTLSPMQDTAVYVIAGPRRSRPDVRVLHVGSVAEQNAKETHRGAP
jgi:phage N-6-adenine-methyltransferase